MGQLVFQATLGGQVNLVGPNTASTFNLNVPAVSSTLATLTGTETFTNKTLTTPVISTISNTGTLTLPTSTDTLVGRATTDTLTNKTLTGAVLNGTLGATTPSTVAATSITASTTFGVTGVATFSAGTASLPAITTTGDTNTGIFFPSADAIAFTKGGAESMRIDSSGYLLVNQTSNTTNSYVQIYGGQPALSVESTSTGGVNQVLIRNPNGTVGSISTSGSLTSYNISSDYRLKENIASLTGALAKITQLKPSVYNYKADPTTNIQGFIAHELQAVIPHAVTGDKDATREEEYEVTPAVKDQQGNITTPSVTGTRTVPVYQGVDASFLIPYLTAAIQEQQATINALTARVVALEAK
jgi:hypothetical protein